MRAALAAAQPLVKLNSTQYLASFRCPVMRKRVGSGQIWSRRLSFVLAWLLGRLVRGAASLLSRRSVPSSPSLPSPAGPPPLQRCSPPGLKYRIRCKNTKTELSRGQPVTWGLRNLHARRDPLSVLNVWLCSRARPTHWSSGHPIHVCWLTRNRLRRLPGGGPAPSPAHRTALLMPYQFFSSLPCSWRRLIICNLLTSCQYRYYHCITGLSVIFSCA